MIKKLAILSLILIACCVASAEEVEDASIRLKETIVTTTGFNENQKKQIKNVIVVRSRDIQDKGYNSVEEVLNSVPGVVISGDFIDIRGQGDAEGSNGVNALNNVKVLVDGIELNLTEQITKTLPINSIPVETIDRIEIINGGGTVLYGSGTSGGVVNIITKKANNNKITGRVYYQNSSYATNKYGVGLGVPVFKGFTVDFAAEKLKGHGYVRGEKRDSKYFKGGFTWDFAQNQRLRFYASRYDADRVRAGQGLTAKEVKADRRQNTGLTDIPTLRKEYVLSYNARFFNKLDIAATAYKQDYKSSVIYGGASRDSKDKKDGINLSTNYNYGSGNFIIGYNFYDAKASRTVRGKITQNKRINSVYLQERHSILENLDAVLGYRFEHAKYENKENTRGLDSTSTENNNAYELGLNYRYSDTGTIYTKYERGFRSPMPIEKMDTLPGYRNGRLNNMVLGGYRLNNLKSEKFDTYEIGIKDMIGNSFVSATAFYTQKKDEINADIRGRFNKKFRNLSETRRYGIELFAEQYLGKLRLSESFSYVNAEITKGDSKGKKVYGAVPQKWTMAANYEVVHGLNVGGNLNYYSKANANTSGERKNSITTFDVSVSYKHDSGIGVQTGIKNLFNKKYYSTARSLDRSGVYTYNPAEERTYYFGVSYNF